MAEQGHRTVPHTADLRVEAWAGSLHDCIAEALRGMIGSFADVRGAEPTRVLEREVVAHSAADLLASAADEVIYLLDADGEIPVSVQVRPSRTGVLLMLALVGIDRVEVTGAVPKAVSFHGLSCQAGKDGRWSASMTVDV